MSARPQKPVYFSNGEALQNPPFNVRLTRFVESVYFFLGLYFTTLLSLDSYAAAENSSFNIKNQSNKYTTRSRWGGSTTPYGGGGGGGGGGGPGFGPRRVGRVDDVRGPECKSCQ
ncbi:hypothetical protein N7449_008612 [Penicillium cf. viridicatum]|uniref:Uncharacterized protein n=1 Tax=Penicillium cf. viridicatum TaxID=2972119 RepID=A0A9W9J8U0_9EURO|nr:hypothetical protein N7449_008612 [Penicillium cf. viridicatum]